jgi:hypothetical protein
VFRDGILRERFLMLESDGMLLIETGSAERIDAERIGTELPGNGERGQKLEGVKQIV